MLEQIGVVVVNVILFFIISFLGYKHWSRINDCGTVIDLVKSIVWCILLWSALGVFIVWQELI